MMVPTNHLLGAAVVATSTKKSKNKSWQKEMCGITYWHIYLMPSVFRKMNGGFSLILAVKTLQQPVTFLKWIFFFKWLSLAVIRNIIYIIAVIFQAKLATTKKIKIWFEFLKCDYFPFPVFFSTIVNDWILDRQNKQVECLILSFND